MKKLLITAVALGLMVATSALAVWVTQPFRHKIDETKLVKLSKVNATRLKADVDKLSIDYANRNFRNVKTLNSAAEFIQAELKKTTQRIEIQNYQVDSEKFHNIIAHFGPTIDLTASYENGSPKPIIIGAHYDAYDNTMGADDNASGVAGLLELARMFAENPPTVPVQIVAYTLEELPNFRTDSMGSRHHAAKLAEQQIKPKLVMVLEMIGYFSDQPNSQDYPISALKWLYPSQGNFIGMVSHFSASSETRLVKSAMAASSSLPAESINAPAWLTGIDFSDHASYWLHNIPAVMITDTSFYRNPNYHQASDTAETLDFTRMAQVVQAVYGVVKHIETEKVN